jgi:hypothetical protein
LQRWHRSSSFQPYYRYLVRGLITVEMWFARRCQEHHRSSAISRRVSTTARGSEIGLYMLVRRWPWTFDGLRYGRPHGMSLARSLSPLFAISTGRSTPWEATEAAGCGLPMTPHDGMSSWSPDADRIAFVSVRDGSAEIYVMDANGSNWARLTDHPAIDLVGDWSVAR